MGKHSRHLRVLLHTVIDLLTEFPDMDVGEACIRAVLAKNERSMIRGFTPVQWFLGRQDSVVGSVINGNLGELSAALDGPEEFRDNL